MDFYTRKFAYVWLRFSELIVNYIVFFYSIIYKKKSRTGEIKSIGAYWYYPPDLTGSNLRMGGWKEYFEKDGFVYDNFHINSFKEWSDVKASGSWAKKYFYFSKCLWLRLPQILKIHRYDVIWIDRSIIPFYPRTSSFLEKRMTVVVKKMVVDSTDGGDYESNPSLMEGVFNSADELTVGYQYLHQLYSKKYKVTQVYWTIPIDRYKIKKNTEISDLPVIGWMGSPGNFEHVKGIIPALKNLHATKPFKFRYICRENMNSFLEDLDVEHHYFGDDYYEILSTFDIGICPFLTKTLRSMGKIAMKHQEFLLLGIPQVCSDVAISEFVEHEKDVLIAKNNSDWEKNLFSLMTDINLYNKLSENSKNLFINYYRYEGQFDTLKNVLTLKVL